MRTLVVRLHGILCHFKILLLFILARMTVIVFEFQKSCKLKVGTF